METKPLHPRQLLLDELERRCRVNPRYSLRAFAKALGISAAALSMILRGERGMSSTLAGKVSKRLGLNLEASEHFVRTSSRRVKGAPDVSKFLQLPIDQFAIISEWYHFGILSLISTKGFQPSTPWIAARLGISEGEARAGVERLVRMGILDTTQAKWKQKGAPIFVNNEHSTAASRRFHAQVLDHARFSLENDPMELRELNSVTIAIDPKQLPYARKKMKEFLVGLMTELENLGSAREVYHLSTQLCPVSRARGN
jgi:DNA-binding Lrp family transcriptional regulator